MAKTIALASSKKTVYNGTSGNLSAAIGQAAITAKDGDTVKLFTLDVGVQLVSATFSNAAFGAGVKGTFYFVPKGETPEAKHKVTNEIDLSSAKVTQSDDHGWFPVKLEDKNHDVILVISGADVTNKDLKYRIQTTSIGNL